MRNALLIAVLTIVPSCAFAQNGGAGVYGEVGIGLAISQNTGSEPFSLPLESGTLAGTIQSDFSSPQGAFGAEVGVATGRWRFGVGQDWIGANIETADFAGTFDGQPLNITLTDDDLESIGIETDVSLMVVSGNVYYSFAPARSPVEPYIGIGVGGAFIKNASTELTLTATAGARFAITPNAYVGARYRFTHIAGPESDSGVKFESLSFHTVSVQLGVYLWSF